MEKLMIGEISARVYLFENNTGHVKASKLLNLMRKGFCEHFGKVKKEEFIQAHPDLTLTKYFDNSFKQHGWFKINETTFGTVVLTQDHNRPKGRRYQIKTIEYDGHSAKNDIVPFIKFHANPEGVLILEKILFEHMT